MGRSSSPTYSPSYSNETALPCSTAYVLVETSICHTTLTPFGGLEITVSECGQKITFSSDHGITTRDGRVVELLTTEYMAPWESVVTGVPTGSVEARVCGGAGQCTTYLESWGTRVLELLDTKTSTVALTTVLTGVSYFQTRPVPWLMTGSSPPP